MFGGCCVKNLNHGFFLSRVGVLSLGCGPFLREWFWSPGCGLSDHTCIPALFTRVSPLLRWNHPQHPLALGKLGLLLMRSLAPQLHLTKPLFARASPGLGHRPWISTHTDFGVPYEQPVFQPLHPQCSAASNPNYCLSVQQTTALSGSPDVPTFGKNPWMQEPGQAGFLSALSALPVA